MKIRRKSPIPIRWIWLFIAIVSGIIGAVFAYSLAIVPIYGLWKTRENVQVSVVIKKWDLDISKSSARSASSLRLIAEYEYQCNGVNYTGSRASLFKYDKSVYYEYSEKSELLCYIDPNDPSYSVIDKRFSMGWLLFVIFVPFILLFLCYASLMAFVKNEIPQVKPLN